MFQKLQAGTTDDTLTVADRLQAFLSGRLGERITLKELSRFLGYSEKICVGRVPALHGLALFTAP